MSELSPDNVTRLSAAPLGPGAIVFAAAFLVLAGWLGVTVYVIYVVKSHLDERPNTTNMR